MTLLEAMFKVQVIEIDTGRIEREVSDLTERRAEKLAAGLNINLNHDRFYVDVVNCEKEQPK